MHTMYGVPGLRGYPTIRNLVPALKSAGVGGLFLNFIGRLLVGGGADNLRACG